MENSNIPEPKRRWFEPACAIVMAMASVATAWCSYQSSNWSERSSDLETQSDKLDRQAMARHLEARQTEEAQMRLFMGMIDARLEGNAKLEAFYIDRFDAELKEAYGKWIALRPYDNPTAPPHPFVASLYHSRYEEEIIGTRAEAATVEARSDSAEHHASSYLGNTVSLATVLFFAGTADKFDQRHVRWSALAFAVGLLLFATVRMVMLPLV